MIGYLYLDIVDCLTWFGVFLEIEAVDVCIFLFQIALVVFQDINLIVATETTFLTINEYKGIRLVIIVSVQLCDNLVIVKSET